MTLPDLLAEVKRRGIRLTPGGTPSAPILHCRPRSAVQADPDLTPHLKEHKPSLLALLAQGQPAGGLPAVTTPPEAPACPPASAPAPGGRVGRPPTKEARRTVPHELSLAERVASGYVNPGWSATAWAARLRPLADRCEAVCPELAATYRRWAANVERPT